MASEALWEPKAMVVPMPLVAPDAREMALRSKVELATYIMLQPAWTTETRLELAAVAALLPK